MHHFFHYADRQEPKNLLTKERIRQNMQITINM